MKKYTPIALLFCISSAYADSVMDAFQSYQESLSPGAQSSSKTASPSSPSVQKIERSSDDDKGCGPEDKQSSMSLKFLSTMIMQKDPVLGVSYDADASELTVRGPKMVSNCSSMLDWKVRDQKTNGSQTYDVEVKFKKNADCDDKLGCMYNVAMVENGDFKKYDQVRFQPTQDGFIECLKYSKVLKEDGGQLKVDSKAIYPSSILQRFPNIVDSGEVRFVSHGPKTETDGAKFGDFTQKKSCDFYEGINPSVVAIQSKAELDAAAEAQRQAELNKQIEATLKCGQYTVIDEFMEKNADLLSSMDGINQKLVEASNRALVEEAKKAIADLAEGKSSESDRAKDIQTIQDFNDKIINQLTNLIVMNSAALEKETDPQMQARLKDRINQDKAALAAYTKDPYVSQGIVKKMLDTGRFDDAKMLFAIQVTASTFSNYGKKIDNVVINSDVAMKRIDASQKQFAKGADDLQEKWAITHGEVTGKAQSEANRYKSIMMTRQTLATNYQNEILREMARTQQPNGYCFQGWRNTNSCVQDSMLRIEQLKQEYQQKDAPLAKAAEESKGKAEEYAKLEGEGKRYIAAQNGEEAPKDADTQIDITVPTPRADMTAAQSLGVPQNGQFAQGQLYNQFQQQGNQFQQQNPQYQQMSMMQYPTGQQYLPYNQFGANVNLQYGYGVNQQNFVNQGMPNFYQPQPVPYAYTMGAYPAMAYGQYNLYR